MSILFPLRDLDTRDAALLDSGLVEPGTPEHASLALSPMIRCNELLVAKLGRGLEMIEIGFFVCKMLGFWEANKYNETLMEGISEISCPLVLPEAGRFEKCTQASVIAC